MEHVATRTARHKGVHLSLAILAASLIGGLQTSQAQNPHPPSPAEKAVIPAPLGSSHGSSEQSSEDAVTRAHRMMGQSPEMQAPPDAGADGHPGINWTVPEGWKSLPANSMRVGNFLVEGSDNRKAEISVIPISGTAGGNLANINRWRGQVQLAPLTEADLSKNSETLALPAGSAVLVDFASAAPMIDGKFKQRVLAGILPQGDTTWFFKVTGEDELVTSLKPAFKNFLGTVTFAAPGAP